MATALPRIQGAQRRRLKWWIVGLGVVVLGLGAFLAVQGGQLIEAGDANIVDYEVAGTASRAAEIIEKWGTDGRSSADVQLAVDYLYLISYGGLLLCWSVYVGELAGDRGWARTRRLGWTAGALGGVAALFDAIENSFLLFQLHRGPSGFTAAAARWFATFKFLFVTAAIVYIAVAGLALLFTRRRSAPVEGGQPAEEGQPVEIRSSGAA